MKLTFGFGRYYWPLLLQWHFGRGDNMTKTYKSDIANAPILFPIGTRVYVRERSAYGIVTGHWEKEGLIIIDTSPAPLTISDLRIDKQESYKVYCCDECGRKWRSDKNGDICVCGKSARDVLSD